jgi:tetratricopeptide (TPR) repeat protein
MRSGRRGLWLVAFASLLVGCGASPAAHHGPGAVAAPAGPPPLFEDLGSYHRAVTTASPRAQAYFDQGLRLVYAFNHVEAQRAFEEAARIDPSCAMCFWGIALCHGSNYNSPTDAERERAATRAVQAAQALAARGTDAERALIEAVARRHSPADASRVTLDRNYADAMREVTQRFPADLDAATLFADALMNLRPWDLWTIDGQPEPGTLEAVAALERVLAANPDHPGANHLYIHAVEASPRPQRATAAADRLAGLMPGAGHMVHMPSHIYFRVGRYEDARVVNERAVAADRVYFTKSRPSPIYQGMYHPHNIDFIWHAAGMEGRSGDAIRAARQLAASVPADVVQSMPDMETMPAAPLGALARFGRWDEILREPAPPASFLYVTGVWHHARGLAYVRTGRSGEATRELTALRALIDRVPAERTVAGFFKTGDVLRLGAEVLAAEIAAQAGQVDEAVRRLTEAARMQDRHWFTEPPPWYAPVRHTLGAVLLEARRPVEAEAVYEEDLRRNPGNGWSLVGLTQALRAQQRLVEAQGMEGRFSLAWAKADVTISRSRF